MCAEKLAGRKCRCTWTFQSRLQGAASNSSRNQQIFPGLEVGQGQARRGVEGSRGCGMPMTETNTKSPSWWNGLIRSINIDSLPKASVFGFPTHCLLLRLERPGCCTLTEKEQRSLLPTTSLHSFTATTNTSLHSFTAITSDLTFSRCVWYLAPCHCSVESGNPSLTYLPSRRDCEIGYQKRHI